MARSVGGRNQWSQGFPGDFAHKMQPTLQKLLSHRMNRSDECDAAPGASQKSTSLIWPMRILAMHSPRTRPVMWLRLTGSCDVGRDLS